jgi:glyoxylase-like metal-dependent hydrolase (beta-lactamase superfamily II)
VDVQKIADGLWRWTALHPDWTPKADWDEEVASFYVESEGDVVLVDPLVPGEEPDRERFLEALDHDVDRAGPPAIVLTVFWHERSASELAERYEGTTVWSYAPTLDRVEGDVTNPFTVDDRLPGGISAIEADREEIVLWIPSHHALAVGDVLLGDMEGGVRVAPDDWFAEGTDPEAFRAAMRPLLELPIERILVGHGRPVLDDALAKLSAALS